MTTTTLPAYFNDLIHATARALAGSMIAHVGAMEFPPARRAAIWREVRADLIETLTHEVPPEITSPRLNALAACRIVVQARRLHGAITADPKLLLRPENADLVPPALKARLDQAFREHFPAIAAGTLYDDDGRAFVPADLLARELGIPEAEVHAAMADDVAPVGTLQRVH